MVVDTLPQLHAALRNKTPAPWPERRRMLLVSPTHFTVAYAINPFMRKADGSLHSVDKPRAMAQWTSLKTTYESLGLAVVVCDGAPGLPDMVFCANQTFPYWSREGKRAVLLSRMRSEMRRDEVAKLKSWFLEDGWEVHEMPSLDIVFEGCGDAIAHPSRGILWGGVGTRTDSDTYEVLAAYTGLVPVRLKLVHDRFYHLDTCFSILDEGTVAIVPEAFAKEQVRMIHEVFDRVINVEMEEATGFLSANCHSPDGKHVLLQKGAKRFVRELERKGFHPIELELGEFMKSGGSVFCMKQQIF